jgi:hypothetical protein
VSEQVSEQVSERVSEGVNENLTTTDLIHKSTELTKFSKHKTLSNEQINKIASVELVSKKEAALMLQQKKVMTVYAFAGLAMSLFGMSLGATVFLSI